MFLKIALASITSRVTDFILLYRLITAAESELSLSSSQPGSHAAPIP